MQALEPARLRPGAADPERERGARVGAGPPVGEPGPELPLLVVRALEARRELRIRRYGLAPALDSAGRLDPRECGDEVRTGQVVRRRERLARGVVGRLLGDRRPAVGAAAYDTPERARRPAELPFDDCPVIHPS